MYFNVVSRVYGQASLSPTLIFSSSTLTAGQEPEVRGLTGNERGFQWMTSVFGEQIIAVCQHSTQSINNVRDFKPARLSEGKERKSEGSDVNLKRMLALVLTSSPWESPVGYLFSTKNSCGIMTGKKNTLLGWGLGSRWWSNIKRILWKTIRA